MDMLGKYSGIKIMRFVLASPNAVHSLRGLANACKASKGAVAQTIAFMKERGMVRQGAVGRTHQYRVDLENPLSRQWKTVFNLEEIADAKILEEVISKLEPVQCVVLYGSLAKGTNDASSDLDLLVIASKKPKARPIIGRNLKREPNVMILAFKEWKALAKKDKVFYDSVILDCIPLFGRKPVVA